ncbi:hypothetical protein RHMOL_Rhmol05G0161900 [Rhododendron molle]|uniref:Uncharacterized protein n=1 Tax=Rhododendron molle TaxID=49168 RepID=A0ACC0NQP0_RHOML|nr:hypothetical protein RHMOL_Rhmol05G0161900 [Rhododendron molle]
MNNENAALVIQIDEERALKKDEIKELNSINKAKNQEVKDITFKIQTKELKELSNAYLELNKLWKETTIAALVASEPQINALTPPQNIDSEEDCVVDEIAPEKNAQSPNSYIKRLKKRTERKNTQMAEYHYTPLKKQPRKAAKLNVQSFKTYEPPVAKQQTNEEHKEHSNDQRKDMDVIDFIPEQYRDMVTTIIKDGSSICVWAAEELGCFVFDNDFRFLMLNETLTSGANQIANDINALIGTVRMTNKVRTVPNAPQQHPESVDCGVIVCYLMDRISRNKEIDPNLSREQCIRFRAKMVVKLLTDRPRSWSPEDNEDDDFDI